MGNSKNEILSLFGIVHTLFLTIASCNNPVDTKEAISKSYAGENQK